jgi:hypothetical protein
MLYVSGAFPVRYGNTVRADTVAKIGMGDISSKSIFKTVLVTETILFVNAQYVTDSNLVHYTQIACGTQYSKFLICFTYLNVILSIVSTCTSYRKFRRITRRMKTTVTPPQQTPQ